MTEETVLAFWFGPLDGDGLAADSQRRRWFQGGAALDDDIRGRFGPLLEQARRGGLDGWRGTARGALALILVCDQFSRHIHRGTAAAFATDPLALEIALALIDAGDDASLALEERAFAYLPLEHAESRRHQHTSVGLLSALRDATPPGRRDITGNYLRHAQQHRDIVLRFGRFPHRNAVLGRRSTAAEEAFLAEGNDFGQTARPGGGSEAASAQGSTRAMKPEP